jgi:hypothetical protein
MDDGLKMIENEMATKRKDLWRNFDATANGVSPGRSVGSRMGRVKVSLSGARDRMLGSAQDISCRVNPWLRE